MRSLLHFIHTYHFIILFILIEFLSIALVIQYNDYQRAAFLNSSNRWAGGVYKKFSTVSNYLSLKEKNQELLNALAVSKDHSFNAFKQNAIGVADVMDSVYVQQYQFIPANIINNSVQKQNNYLTLDIGRKQGVDKGMAVVAPNGVVGVVKDVSANFASVISLLNQNLRISAMLKESGYFGSINWDGTNYRYITFSDLPNHITIHRGDTVITSGYSAMFPKGELVGVVDTVDQSQGGEFIQVRVKLAVDFKKVKNVMVVKNLFQSEQLMLEESVHD
ncbi:MAG: rod shape-determining protein MreC [Salinivirgaceae bacterium]|nr:rod shape-determining protein MreC [Salinivirgaceae bacterium]